ncbi:MAG: cation:proton antiporter subunit C [bacterium]
MLTKIIANVDFIFAIILFCIGLYGVATKTNLIKKLIGLNIIETSVYLFFIALGDARFGENIKYWGRSPVIMNIADVKTGKEVMINPIPTGLILTAIVVSVSVTAFALSLAVKLYEHYGTLDTSKIKKLRG